MIATFPQPPPAYQLSEALSREPSRAIIPTPPDECEREELLLNQLGVRGWGRICHFRQFYGSGWGTGAGRPVSPRALEGLYRFLEQATFPQGRNPSVFLTDDGNLELCWEDSAGKAVQVEFTPAGAEFYVESSAREESVDYSEIAKLAAELIGG